MTDRLDDQMGEHGHVRVPPMSADELKALGVIFKQPVGQRWSVCDVWARLDHLERLAISAVAAWLVWIGIAWYVWWRA